MKYLKPLIDLVLYGNFWIAACAVAMCWLSLDLTRLPIQWNPAVGFAACGTLFLYAVHRIVGIRRLDKFFEVDRYAVIARFRHHIMIYAVIGLIGSVYYFFQLELMTQASLFLPGLLGLGYVVPFFGEGRRLRDLNDIKIFLVALVWAWITVVLPLLEVGIIPWWVIGLMAVERAAFIFAITLPFDIRDLRVDDFSAVRTLPARLGIDQTKRLAYGCLLMSVLLAINLFWQEQYEMTDTILLLIGYLAVALLVNRSTPERSDYFYSGLMDGTMIGLFLLVWLF